MMTSTCAPINAESNPPVDLKVIQRREFVDKYMLPRDAAEKERLAFLHYLLRYALDQDGREIKCGVVVVFQVFIEVQCFNIIHTGMNSMETLALPLRTHSKTALMSLTLAVVSAPGLSTWRGTFPPQLLSARISLTCFQNTISLKIARLFKLIRWKDYRSQTTPLTSLSSGLFRWPIVPPTGPQSSPSLSEWPNQVDGLNYLRQIHWCIDRRTSILNTRKLVSGQLVDSLVFPTSSRFCLFIYQQYNIYSHINV